MPGPTPAPPSYTGSRHSEATKKKITPNIKHRYNCEPHQTQQCRVATVRAPTNEAVSLTHHTTASSAVMPIPPELMELSSPLPRRLSESDMAAVYRSDRAPMKGTSHVGRKGEKKGIGSLARQSRRLGSGPCSDKRQEERPLVRRCGAQKLNTGATRAHRRHFGCFRGHGWKWEETNAQPR